MARGMFDAKRSDEETSTADEQKPGQMPDIGEKASWDQLHQHTQQVVRAANAIGSKFRQMFNT